METDPPGPASHVDREPASIVDDELELVEELPLDEEVDVLETAPFDEVLDADEELAVDDVVEPAEPAFGEELETLLEEAPVVDDADVEVVDVPPGCELEAADEGVEVDEPPQAESPPARTTMANEFRFTCIPFFAER